MILLSPSMRKRYTRAAGQALVGQPQTGASVVICSWCGAELDFIPFACPSCDMANTVMECSRDEIDFWGIPQRDAYQERMTATWDPMTTDEARAALKAGLKVYAHHPGDDVDPYLLDDEDAVLGAEIDGHSFWLEKVIEQVIEQANVEAEAAPEVRPQYKRLRLRAIEFREAAAYIDQFHRHHQRPSGWKFGTCVVDDDGNICGVIIVARPVAREIANRHPDTLEVVRCCTDGSKNAASMLYSAAWSAARALGYRRLITYVLESEPGTSLKAVGWKCVAKVRGKSWNTPTRQRIDKAPTCDKWRWEVSA